MAVLACGTNVFEGTATGEAEHPIPAEAFTRAERIAKQNARDLRDYYAALKCPPEQDKCPHKTVVQSDVDPRPAWVRGRPGRRRGYYYIKVGWDYRVVIRCEANPVEVVTEDPPPPPVSDGGTGSADGNEPVEEHVCAAPDPAVSHTAGTQIGASATFAAPSGVTVETTPAFQRWHAIGPGPTLDAWLAATSCEDGCTLYWDPEPEYELKSAQMVSRIRYWWDLTNDIEAACR